MNTQIKHLASAPETLTDEQISALFDYHTTEDKSVEFWELQTQTAKWELVMWGDNAWGLYLGNNGVKAWNEHKTTHTDKEIIREAYSIIYANIA